MGHLYYGNESYQIELADRPLAHLKVAMLSLLRSGQSIAFSFTHPANRGSGRETLWITPATNVRFRFEGARPPALNEQWVRAIMASANTATGMHLVPEPVADPSSEALQPSVSRAASAAPAAAPVQPA